MTETYYDTIFESYDILYNNEQKIKLNLAKRLISKYYSIDSETKVLDLGCGSGLSSDFNCYLVGLDNSLKLLELAKQKYLKDKRKNFIFFDVNKKEPFDFDSDAFDLTISLSAFHHFDDFVFTLKEIKRVTKKLIIISIPSRVTKFRDYDDSMIRAIKINGLKLLSFVDNPVDRFYVIGF